MTDLNLVMIEGRLGDDPKISRQGKRSHARCRVATNRRWKGDDGEWHERATWHLVVAFDVVAEQIALLRKGDGIFVRGELNVREYVASDEAVRYEHQIVAHDVRSPLKILVAGAETPRQTATPSRNEQGPARVGRASASSRDAQQARYETPAPVRQRPVQTRPDAQPPRPSTTPRAEDELPAEDVFGDLEQFIQSGGDQ
ncbi:single-stranded DNA-binding protein [Metallibacterium scheffleri]|nr:single-stranded DNA-binding protein [Metallibacterium scheffleri]